MDKAARFWSALTKNLRLLTASRSQRRLRIASGFRVVLPVANLLTGVSALTGRLPQLLLDDTRLTYSPGSCGAIRTNDIMVQSSFGQADQSLAKACT
jgi:hypothetical protein